MSRPKPLVSGKRVGIWLPPKYVKIAKDIDNLSNFIQIALDQAPSIMAWAMLAEAQPDKFNMTRKIEDVKDEFNDKYPQDKLTQKRTNKWPKNSPKTQELW